MAKRKFDINDQEIITRVSNIETYLINEYEDYFNEISENFNLVSGHIYSDADLEKLFGEKRPTFQSNLFMPILMKIAGDFKENLPAIDFLPTTPDDQDKAGIIKEVNSWTFYQKNDIAHQLAKAFLFAAIGRNMWLKQDFTYTKDPEGSVEISSHHPFLKADSHTDRDLTNCQFISDAVWLTIDEIVKIYAKKDEELASILRKRKEDLFGADNHKTLAKKFLNYLEKLTGKQIKYLGEKSGYDSNRIWSENGIIYDKQGLWHNVGRFRTIDLYHREEYPQLTITDRVLQKQMDFTDMVQYDENEPRGQSDTWYNNDKLQQIKNYLPDSDAIVTEDFTNKVIQTSVCPGLQLVLYDGPAQLQNKQGDYKFTKIQCYDFHPDMLETKSVVDNIKDPVKSFNLRDNTNLTYLLRATHLEWLISDKYRGKVTDMNSNKIGGIRYLPQEMMQEGERAFHRIDPPQRDIATTEYQMMQGELVNRLSGVNDNSKGISQGEKSGKLFLARSEASETMQSWITENGQAALLAIAKKNVFYFQNFLTERRVIRLLDDSQKPNWLIINDQDEYGNILNDITVGEYDVVASKVAVGKIAKELEDQRDIQLIEISGKLPGFETISKILVRDIISRQNVSTKGELIPLINKLIQLDMMKIEQAMQPPQPIQQPQVDPVTAQMGMMKATNEIHKGELDNEGKQIDNDKKKLDIASLSQQTAAQQNVADLVQRLLTQNNPQVTA